MNLYNLKSHPFEPKSFVITKFDEDLNIESTYGVSEVACECPQGHKATCRHRKMLPIFFNDRAIRLDTTWFLDYDTRQWHEPFQARMERHITKEEQARIDAIVALTRKTSAIAKPIVEEMPLIEGTEPPDLASTINLPPNTIDEFGKLLHPHAGEGPEPSTVAANHTTSPSVSGRGQPAPRVRRI